MNKKNITTIQPTARPKFMPAEMPEVKGNVPKMENPPPPPKDKK